MCVFICRIHCWREYDAEKRVIQKLNEILPLTLWGFRVLL